MAYEGFAKLKAQLGSRPGVTNPGALAASIGRKKYGSKQMAHGAASGHSLQHAKVIQLLHRRRKAA